MDPLRPKRYRSWLYSSSRRDTRTIPKSTYYRWKAAYEQASLQQESSQGTLSSDADDAEPADDQQELFRQQGSDTERPADSSSALDFEGLTGEDMSMEDEDMWQYHDDFRPEEGDDHLYDSEEQPQLHHDDDPPIFPGLECTKGQLASLVMAFFLCHKITKAALVSLLTILNAMIPGCIPKSNFLFQKLFFAGSDNISVDFFCPHCDSYFGEGENFVCPVCKQEFTSTELMKSQSFILTSPISIQLRDMLESTGLWDSIKKVKESAPNGQSYSDIYTGSQYNSTPYSEFLTSDDNNFSCTFSTDGVRITKSSNVSMWPVFCVPNEIPFQDRSKYVVLAGLTLGTKKPSPEILLTKFIKEAVSLFRDGFQWKDTLGTIVTSRICFNICICDAPVRAMISNFKQYNGYFGCGWCKHRGERATARTGGDTMVFPLQFPFPAKRTHDESYRQATDVVQLNLKPVDGVKGLSILYGLPLFNIISGMIPDYMHCLLLGVVSDFTEKWFTYRDRPFYIREKSALDENMLAIKPPEEIRRDPRSLLQFFSGYKAGEWRNFLLFYSPVVLRGRLPTVYYRHWLLLVNALHMLLAKEIPKHVMPTVKLLIFKFIEQIPSLYGNEDSSYNVHILQHLVESVEEWGAPWASSMFLFEDCGGRLKRLFHGSTSIGKQMFTRFLAGRKLRDFSRNYIPQATYVVRQCYSALDHPIVSYDRLKRCEVEEKGAGKVITMEPAEQLALERLVGKVLHCNTAISHQRIRVNHKLFSTRSYCEKFKRDNSYVSFGRNLVCRIENFLLYDSDCLCKIDARQSKCLSRTAGPSTKLFVIVDQLKTESVSPIIDDCTQHNLTYFVRKVVPKDDSFIAINPDLLHTKCVSIPDGKSDAVFVIDNKIRFELD